MLSLRLVAGTASEDAYTLLRFIQKQNDKHQELASLEQTALALTIPEQTATGKETSNLFMSGSDDEIPPPPQTPTQQAPHTVSTIKLPILKKGEYDMENEIDMIVEISRQPSHH
ncbi:hypothetical protein Tco_0972830 [Tanacetum coccineum]